MLTYTYLQTLTSDSQSYCRGRTLRADPRKLKDGWKGVRKGVLTKASTREVVKNARLTKICIELTRFGTAHDPPNKEDAGP